MIVPSFDLNQKMKEAPKKSLSFTKGAKFSVVKIQIQAKQKIPIFDLDSDKVCPKNREGGGEEDKLHSSLTLLQN